MAIDYSNLSWSQRVTQGKLRVTRRSQSVTRKLPEFSRYIPPKQRQRNVQKSALHVESWVFLLIRPANFFGRFHFRRRLALHYFIFCLSKL